MALDRNPLDQVTTATPRVEPAPTRPAAPRRNDLANRINRRLDLPMAVLSVLMLAVVLADVFVATDSPAQHWLDRLSWAIWAVFVVEFAVKLVVVEDRRKYLRTHWFDVLVVLMPMFRVARALRFVAGVEAAPLLEMVAFVGKGTKALRRFSAESQLGYLLGLTTLVTFFGAVGVYLFERDAPGTPMRSFGDALWWSAALMTTIGSEMAPVSPGGRVLAFGMMVFATVVVVYLIGAVSAFLLATRGERLAERRATTPATVDAMLGEPSAGASS